MSAAGTGTVPALHGVFAYSSVALHTALDATAGG